MGTYRPGFTLLELMIVLAILVTVMAIAWPRIARRIQLVGPREAALQVKSDLAVAREQAIITGEAWAFRVERGTGNYQFGPVSAMKDSFLDELTPPDPSTEIFEEAVLPEGEAGKVTPPATVAIPAMADGSLVTGVAAPIDKAKLIRSEELPTGMIFDDGFAHSASEANQLRLEQNPNQPTLPQPVQQSFGSTGYGGVPTQTTTTLGGAFPMPANPATQQNVDIYRDQKWKFAVVFQTDGRATNSEIVLKEQPTENKIRLRVRGLTGGVTMDKLERKQRAPQLLDPELRDEQLLDEELLRQGETSVQSGGNPNPNFEGTIEQSVPYSGVSR